MPPKKKKSGGKKKKGDTELTIDEKYKKTLQEIEALKDHLAVRKEYARRSHEASEEWKERMQKAEQCLELKEETHKAVGADMTRQYKAMQNELNMRIFQLESELSRTRAQLEKTEQELQKSRNDHDKMMKEKDLTIEMLTMKVNTMCTQFETLFHDYMDKLVEKVTVSKGRWEKQSAAIQCQNKQLLLDFGLNPLDF
jgi:chromosome segregation ATPase